MTIIRVNQLKNNISVIVNGTELISQIEVPDAVPGGGGDVTTTELNTRLALKVDKVSGKGLSKNDFTDADKAKLDSLSPGLDGEDGIDGINGTNGTNGVNGEDGADGLSAYQVALANGFVGTQAAWLASLVGPQGLQGIQGIQGLKGDTGEQGIQGIQGIQGNQGIQGIQGETGPTGPQGPAGASSSANKVTTEVNFGTSGDYIQATVSAAWITSGTHLLLTIVPNLADHDTEDVLLEELKCTYGNIINGVSFDLHVHAPNETHGRYIVTAIGV
jgi:hypothetical protein